tara:strand:+ start:1487 stop:1606 length:120 start_codon:yes stop_codon:yes gene_type:complete
VFCLILKSRVVAEYELKDVERLLASDNYDEHEVQNERFT